MPQSGQWHLKLPIYQLNDTYLLVNGKVGNTALKFQYRQRIMTLRSTLSDKSVMLTAIERGSSNPSNIPNISITYYKAYGGHNSLVACICFKYKLRILFLF